MKHFSFPQLFQKTCWSDLKRFTLATFKIRWNWHELLQQRPNNEQRNRKNSDVRYPSYLLKFNLHRNFNE